MIVYIIAAAIIVAFAASLWRKYQQGDNWRHDLSFFVDLAAMAVTALVVGSLAFVQLRTPVSGAPEESAISVPLATTTTRATPIEATATTPARATRTPRQTATPRSDLTAEPVETQSPTMTPRPADVITFTPTVEESATEEPTATPTETVQPTTPPPPPATATTVRTSFNYTVVAGDTVSIIARRFGVTSEQIAAANPGLNSDRLSIDQVLVIPAPGGTAPAPAPVPSFTNYAVRAGDVLSVIARDQGVSVAALLAANPGLTADSTLQIGQILRIPR